LPTGFLQDGQAICGDLQIDEDVRPEFANADRFPEADDLRVVRRFEAALGGLPIEPRAYLVIVTCGHLHNLTVLRQALRTPASYIGMIGSRHKRKQVFDALSREGFSERDLNRMHSPIGIDISAESCDEIAVNIVAELVQARARNWGR
jgi:xanthine dehydrogenase accessory factor